MIFQPSHFAMQTKDRLQRKFKPLQKEVGCLGHKLGLDLILGSLSQPGISRRWAWGVFEAPRSAQPTTSWKSSALQPWLCTDGHTDACNVGGSESKEEPNGKMAFVYCQFSLPAKAVALLAPSTPLAAASSAPLCRWSP